MKKKITIQDIANEANVSKTTVSFYLNSKFEKMSESTKEKIRKVIETHQYRPNITAQSLKSKKTKIIGIIVADITIDFSNLLVKGADVILDELGYQIIVGSSNFNFEREKNYINRMLDMGVDGIIVQPSNELIESGKKLINKQCPIIYVDSVNPSIQKDEVLIKTKDIEVIDESFDVLTTFNYNKYIFVTEDVSLLQVREDRLNGFNKSAKKRNLNTSVIYFEDPKQLKNSLKNELDGKTLLYCSNGRVTQHTFNCLREMNIDIPNQVGLIGFDSWAWTKYSTPKITTINQPNFEEGQAAAKKIINLINGVSVESNELKANIIWEGSTK